jgi:potassium channel subfamily K protein 1
MTPTGKMICILYAVIGIPFTLIFLSALVQRLLAPTFKLLSSFIRKLPHMDTFQV